MCVIYRGLKTACLDTSQDFEVEGGNEKVTLLGQLLFQYPAMDTTVIQLVLEGGGKLELGGISPFPLYDPLLGHTKIHMYIQR